MMAPAETPRSRAQGAAAPGQSKLRAQAWVLGTRLELRGHAPFSDPPAKPIAETPRTYSMGPDRFAVAFRYGVIVFFGLSPGEERRAAEALAAAVAEPFAEPETEEVGIRVEPEARERIDPEGFLVLRSLDVERLQVVAHILAKSAVLSHFEARVAGVFDRVEARARELQRGPNRRRSRELLAEIGRSVAIQAQTVGRVEVTEKPELTWDDAELDRLYERLAIEYEIRDRDAALSRKLKLVSDTAATALDVIHTQQGLRVEWYIVALIAIEIVLIVYDLSLR